MNFIHKMPKSSKKLPCTLISLNNWKLIKITGKDTIQYLQGQLTCNMNTINKNKYIFSGYCNPYGKIINTMYVFYLNSGIGLIQRDEICNKQITTMKKYAIFSDITITIENNFELFGIVGQNARKKLSDLFKILPNTTNTIVYDNTTGIIILYFEFPQERFLLIIPIQKIKNIFKILTKDININNHLQWNSLDIEAGYPILNIETSEKFIPQAINLHILNAISFNKGCYIGQEIIARTKYKDTNKRALYWLTGSKNNKLPKINSNLEITIHNTKWKPNGIVLESCQIDTGEIWIQAILHKNTPDNSQLKIIDEATNNLFKISPLPYSII